MKVRFHNPALDRLETDRAFTGGFSPDVVTAFRKRMQQLRAVTDERDIYAIKSLHFEKLKGARDHQRSIRLNDQWRLILEIEKQDNGNVLVLISIEDYH